MRILFAGSPEIAVPSLAALSENFDIAGVLTNPDSSSGRGKKLSVTPVKEKAVQLGLPLFQPASLDEGFLQELKGCEPDLLVSVAFGRIFKRNLLELFPSGGVNLHPSLLPLYRGPSPLTAAILGGDDKTGITVQKLALKMDSGDILLQKEFPLTGRETTGSLMEYVAPIGAEMLVDAVRRLEDGTAQPVAQDETRATYCGIVKKKDGRIDWSAPAAAIDRAIRAYTPWPGAYTHFRGKTLKILEGRVVDTRTPGNLPGLVTGIDKKEGILIQTVKGILAVSRLQLQAKKPLGWKNFLNGVQNFSGSVLGDNQ